MHSVWKGIDDAMLSSAQAHYIIHHSDEGMESMHQRPGIMKRGLRPAPLASMKNRFLIYFR